MSVRSFWERSWKNLDRERLSSYLACFDDRADSIIRYLQKQAYKRVCDAGCGCGVYARKLALHGFSVSGFDISEDAVALTKRLLSENGVLTQGFRTADVRSTAYPDGQFDAAVARDVLDHMPLRDAMAALGELLRIVRSGGCVLLALDAADSEYESEPHTVNGDGDYLYSGGKWKGMVFHPYTPDEIGRLTLGHAAKLLAADESGFTLVLEKA